MTAERREIQECRYTSWTGWSSFAAESVHAYGLIPFWRPQLRERGTPGRTCQSLWQRNWLSRTIQQTTRRTRRLRPLILSFRWTGRFPSGSVGNSGFGCEQLAGSLRRGYAETAQLDDAIETLHVDRELVAGAADRQAPSEAGAARVHDKPSGTYRQAPIAPWLWGRRPVKTDDYPNRSAANAEDLAASFEPTKQ